ncbi:MAG: NAD(P)-dependent alcohol dehydrogenase [Chloroflexota bacterium]
MKAIVYHIYGSPAVLTLQDVAKPVPKADEVLVNVRAASVNPYEWHAMRGTPPIRIETGFFKPKEKIIRADIAGSVEAVGENVTQFQPGDAVFGRSIAGGFAEQVCIAENRLAMKPANCSFKEAAAVPLAALTALQGLRDKGHIQAGQHVLINGASGGIGTFAVQIAKSFGAYVTGVCSTKNGEMVHSIGADRVIDYTQNDFTQTNHPYDLILDTVGNRSISAYKRALKPTGRCVILGFSSFGIVFQVLLLGTLTGLTSNKKIGLMNADINQEDLNFMKALLETDQVTPVIDRCYPLESVPEALQYLGKRHARGKVIIDLA